MGATAGDLIQTEKGNPTVRMTEMFVSSQGEGALSGTESIFIRLSGCNLRCWFCDTPYTSWQPEGERVLVEEIVRVAQQTSIANVVVTGGEPLLQPAIVPLTESLADVGKHITIETAGTVFQPVTCHLMSISPKLASSNPRYKSGRASEKSWNDRHERLRWQPKVIRQLIAQSTEYQLKFVVQDPADCRQVEEGIAEFSDMNRSSVWLMPEGTDVATLDQRALWLRPWCATRGYRYCDRWHLRWYGSRRGT
jgi:7-carboxy-7-deazaguanine synthase